MYNIKHILWHLAGEETNHYNILPRHLRHQQVFWHLGGELTHPSPAPTTRIKVKSGYQVNTVESITQLDIAPNYVQEEEREDSIYLDDFTCPEIYKDQEFLHSNEDNLEQPHRAYVDYDDRISNDNMSVGDEYEPTNDVDIMYACSPVIPRQVYVAISAETSAAAASRRPTEFPCTVTLPNDTTQLTITAEMAAKVGKVITDCTMMSADATPNELLTYNYFNCQETQRLQQYRGTLEERKKQVSISSLRRRQLSLSSTGATTRRHKSRYDSIPEGERSRVTRNLERSFLTLDSEGMLVPKTTELPGDSTTTTPPGDSNKELHRQQMKALALAAKGIQSRKRREHSRSRSRVHRSRSPPHRRSSNKGSSRQRSRSRSRSRFRRSSSGDIRDTGPCGARCFTRRIREA